MKYSNEQIRGAIFRAADRIERAPQSFNFGECFVPRDGGCGTTACAWGWIGFELGMAGDSVERVAKNCGLVPPSENRGASGHLYDFCQSMFDTKTIPNDLRAYADKYFPASVIAEDRQLVSWDQCAWQPKAVA